MRNTSLCYLENRSNYLMLHRVKKEIDENKDKWIGIGGKFEEGESPEDCAVREIMEETGMEFIPEELRYRAVVTFVSDEWGTEYMHLFTAAVDQLRLSQLRGKENEEGTLEWVPVSDVESLPIWEGDKIFLRLLAEDAPFFSLKLEYQGDRLVKHSLYLKEN
ncbi:MAG: NUDIX domain-containing protein [Oscillospiraceae bacterium]|nr:NUDIX domain-containing protein [Oscillospiraceae bacterium]